MLNFPLYDTLLSLSENHEPLTREERVATVKTIGAMDQGGQHKIFAIVTYYQKLHGLPALTPAATVTLNFNQLCADLQVLIKVFCELHQKYMRERLCNERNWSKIKHANKTHNP